MILEVAGVSIAILWAFLHQQRYFARRIQEERQRTANYWKVGNTIILTLEEEVEDLKWRLEQCREAH